MFKKDPDYPALQSCGYCFRMIVPKDLQKTIGKTELRYSLQEGSLRRAKNKAKIVASQVTGFFNKLRKDSSNMVTLTREKINQLISEYVKQSIADAENIRATNMKAMTPETNDDHDEHLAAIDSLEGQYKEALGLGNLRFVRAIVIRFLKDKGIELDPDSDDFLRMSHEMLKAQIKLLQVERMHSLGDYSYQDVDISPAVPKGAIEPEIKSEPLSEIVGGYWNEKVNDWKPRSQVQYKGIQDFLLEKLGPDTPIHEIDYEKGREFKAALMAKKN